MTKKVKSVINNLDLIDNKEDVNSSPNSIVQKVKAARGSRDDVALTVKFKKSEWKKLRDLSENKNLSLQAIIKQSVKIYYQNECGLVLE